ncbi:GNAT family N-acetyltransferase [Maridesulfovibrio salexigens]|uniref:BioF2-like acetyltransferase domain-containing protein n=1 Tax=Maridesulfovibrio salexigens (strain ATCC 14822 / DSM 2638 / NCIMB 8403 / VKM B-1763) TaxID=526222 RepID=C6BTX9_MARSD|nr:GNAT family N-acetyltransferase [Maridesulfovibrio salexigens]ACS81688.1 hypothetical protein Desal_3642 [Maridesulfovibrio salexigens DSM 2638]
MNQTQYNALTYWHDTPDQNFLKTAYAPTFKIDCCDCFGVAQLDPFFCYSSEVGLAITKFLSAYQLRILHGPVCENFEKQKLENWCEYLLSLSDAVRATSISVMPPYYNFFDNPALADDYDSVFTSAGFTRTKKHTVVLDIAQGEEAIFKKLKYETRRSVRRVAETDIKIVDLKKKEHIELWQDIKGRKSTIDTRRINNIAAQDNENYSYFVAVLDGEPLAWSGATWGKEVGYVEGITTAPAARYDKKKRFANYALQWHIIKEAIRREVKWFDYVGAEPDSGDPKKINIMKFKLSWGGELVSYNQYDKDINFLKSKLVQGIQFSNAYRKQLQQQYQARKK